MSRKSILVCLPTAPYPARRNGISIRYAPVLTALSASHDIDLVQIVSKWAGQMKAGADEGTFRNIDTITRPIAKQSLPRRVLTRGRTFVFPRPPHVCFSSDHKWVGEQLQALLAGRHYDIGLWITLGFADLAAPILRKHCDRIVYDAIDSVLSVELKKANQSPLTRWDNYWLRRWEQSICREFDRAIYISKSDIDLFTVDAPALRRDIAHLPNGIFHQDRVSEED